MKFYWLALGILSVWRLTHLLNAEDGPWDLVIRLRRLAGTGFWASLLDCFYCLSLWIAAPVACWIGGSWKERLLLWLALSAAAIVVERPDRTTQSYYSDVQEDHDVLRQEPAAVPDAESDQTADSGGT